jgi:hypothetical protein
LQRSFFFKNINGKLYNVMIFKVLFHPIIFKLKKYPHGKRNIGKEN